MLNSETLSDKTTNHRVRSIVFKKIKTETDLEENWLLKHRSLGEYTDFWKLWVRYQDYLYQRCLTWMKGNPIEAQEALSRASIKGWEKWQNHAGTIINPRAWLAQLTHNLCMDMHRERTKEASSMESLEQFAVAEDEYLTSTVSSPELTVLSRERDAYIRSAVNALPAKLYTPFILRYYQEMSYQEIAQQLALSNDNVRKRVQQARTILKKRLNKYFAGLDDASSLATSLNSLMASDCETVITAGCTPKSIDSKVTATCLEVLPHAWYSSLSSLGWR